MPFGIKDLKNFLRQFFRAFILYLTYKIMWVMCMIKKQETMILSEYTGIYDLVVWSYVNILDTKRRLL